jgi:hypothetical protein
MALQVCLPFLICHPLNTLCIRTPSCEFTNRITTYRLISYIFERMGPLDFDSHFSVCIAVYTIFVNVQNIFFPQRIEDENALIRMLSSINGIQLCNVISFWCLH